MPQATPIQQSFSAGEWSKTMQARTDLQNYDLSCTSALNFFAKAQGMAQKRAGTKFVSECKFHDKTSKLISFIVKENQSYMLELGDEYLRVYKDQALVVEDSATITNIVVATGTTFTVTTSAAHGYSNGDQVYISGVVGMTNINMRRFEASNVTGTTFDITVADSSVHGTYSSGGEAYRPYEATLGTPLAYGGHSGSTVWEEADIENIQYDKSNDVMYLAMGEDKAPLTISRFGDRDWRVEQYEFIDGPYLNLNTTETTLTPSATTGTGITITASADLFAATDVGRHIRIRNSGTWGYAEITAFVSATEVTADVKEDFGGTVATATWRLGAFSDTTGWPTSVQFFQGRLFWFKGNNIYGSVSSGFNDFSPTEPDSSVEDSNSLQEIISGGADSSEINFAIDIQKGLALGTLGGEWIFRSGQLSAALTPTNKAASRSTTFGCKKVRPVRVGEAVLFVQRTGRVLGELTFSFENDSFISRDLTLFSSHIAEDGIKRIAYQSEPDNILWCVTESGRFLSMSYKPAQEVNGWFPHSTTNGKVLDVDVIPTPDDKYSQPWFIIERNINGSTFRYVEFLERELGELDLDTEAFPVDCGLSLDNRTKPTDSKLNVSSGSVGDTKTFTIPSYHSGIFTAEMVGSRIRFCWERRGVKGVAYVEISAFNNSRSVDVDFLTDVPDIPELNGINEVVEPADWFIYDEVSTITGLHHLEGETVDVWADGAVLTPQTVENGQITLSAASAIVAIGYKYRGIIASRDFDNGGADGTSVGKIKRIDRVIMGFYRTLGGQVGGSLREDSLQPLEFRDFNDTMNTGVPLITGYTEESFRGDFDDGAYNRKAVVYFVHDDPAPAAVTAIIPKMVTQDGK